MVPLLVANNLFSNYHLKQILNTVERTEDSMEYFGRDRLALTPTANGCYRAGKRVGRIYCGFEMNQWVKDRVVPSAKKLREELTVENYSLRTVEPFPFGGEFAEAIARYSDHLDAWIKLSSTLEECQTFQCFDESLKKPSEITASFKVSKIAFDNVKPKPLLFNSGKRLEKIFAD